MLKHVYLNGKHTTIDQATISVLDRGFLFGDGIYEVIPAYNGHLFALDKHLQRLQQSCDAINLQNPYSAEQWQTLFNELITKNQAKHTAIYLQITRGVMKERSHLPTELTPTVFIACKTIELHSIEKLSQGLHAITLPDPRWQFCYIKSTSLIANVMALQLADKQDAQAAIFIRDGLVTEECMRNVFMVKDNVIYTPKKDEKILPGVTRDVIIELARSNHLTVKEIDITEKQLLSADEVFLTSSTKEIVPAQQINQQTINNGRAGPVWQQLIKLYHQFIENHHD